MTLQAVFQILNTLPLFGWAALVLAPLRREALVAAARGVAVAEAVAYLLMLGAGVAQPGGMSVDFTHLDALARGFSHPAAMLIGWTHYLAFDLWVGSWQVEEAHRRAMPHWAVVPCLALTFLAGPVGLLVFLLLRAGFRRRVTL